MGMEVHAHASETDGFDLKVAGRKRCGGVSGCPCVFPRLRAKLLAVEDALTLYAKASAVVAVMLRARDGLEVLLTERATREGDPWSGQWSFPGGHRLPGEPSYDAVCRETEEEVGLSPRAARLLGCLEARSPANRPETLVLPFVFRWDGRDEPRPGSEVAATSWIPLADLPAARQSVTVAVRGHTVEMPAFVHGGRVIWGFTYRALEDLLRLLD